MMPHVNVNTQVEISNDVHHPPEFFENNESNVKGIDDMRHNVDLYTAILVVDIVSLQQLMARENINHRIT